jgi:hypothetical protein
MLGYAQSEDGVVPERFLRLPLEGHPVHVGGTSRAMRPSRETFTSQLT